MAKIAFVTDSTAYLTEEQIQKYNITVVPLSVIFEGEAYREGVDMTAVATDRAAVTRCSSSRW